MPTNQELAVILKFQDDASAAFKRTVASLHQDVEALSGHLRRLSSTLRETGRNLTQIGAVLTGPFAAALAAASSRSVAVHSTLIHLRGSFADISKILAEAVLPIVNRFADFIRELVDRLKTMDPAVRDNALRLTFLAGAFALIAGPSISLLARLTKLTSILLGVAAALTPVQTAILALAVGVVSLLAATGQLGNALALLARVLDFVANAFAQLVEFALLPARFALEGVAASIRLVLEGLALLPGPFRKSRQEIREWARDFERQTRQAATEGVKNMLQYGKQAMEAASGAGQGAGAPFTEMVRSARRAIAELRRLLSGKEGSDIAKGFTESFKAVWEQFTVETLDLGKKAANALVGFFRSAESGMAQTIEKFLTQGGKFKDFLKSIGQNIRQAFLSMISQLIAAVLIAIPIALAIYAIPILGPLVDVVFRAQSMTAIGMAAGMARGLGNIPTKHQGGIIQRFQQGGEVLAMLEPGEFVVNRRSTERNRELLESINAGRGGSGQESATKVAVLFNINAIDPKTGAEFLMRNSKAIADAVNQEILRNNQSYRRTSRRFA